MKGTVWLAVLAAVITIATRSEADEACSATVARADVVRCAVRASLGVRAELQAGEALEGRRVAATPLLPANPTVGLSLARRTADVGRATNWSATLAQEVQIGGQRGARREAAEEALNAQGHRVEVARRDAAAGAWIAYFDALAADDEVRLTRKLSANAGQIAVVARGMSDRGLLSGVEADVADAATVAVEQVHILAERRVRGTRLALATLLGLDASQPIVVEGELTPLRGVEDEARQALGSDGRDRPEVRALDAERRSFEASASAWRRSRIPNPTLSFFVQNDGFDERVIGGGILIPIPLPQPLGRTYNGEIAEATALANRAATEAERTRRLARLQLLTALADYEARKRQRDAFTDERVTRAEQDIDAIAREIQTGRLAIRDALISQQALVNLLRSALEARVALCDASVDLARAAGIPLDRGAR